MPIDVDVVVLDPMDSERVRDLFGYCLDALARRASATWRARHAMVSPTWDNCVAEILPGPGVREYRTSPLGGLPARLRVIYAPCGELVRDDSEGGGLDGPVRVSLTSDSTGGPLLTELVACIGVWLDQRGLAWRWRGDGPLQTADGGWRTDLPRGKR
jgi:hypothetical protein